MLIINNDSDTKITLRVYEERVEDRTNFYLKFTDSSNTNSVILELTDISAYPKKYNQFLILENSDIPTGRGLMEFYASNQSGLTEMNEADKVNTQEYELEAVDTFEIVQYYPEKIDFIYYKQQ